MRILHFINGIHPGGKERRMIELLKYIRLKFREPPLLAVMSREIGYRSVFDLGIEVRYLIRKVRKDPGIWREFDRLCREYRPDVIHVWDSMTAIYAAPVAWRRNVPLVNSMITNAPSYIAPGSSSWIRSKITFPLSTAIVANSKAGLRSYRAPANKSICIYNGFDFKRCNSLDERQTVRERLGIRREKIVGMVGEFADRKDYETYIRTASTILRCRNDTEFVAVGDGPNLEHIRSMVDPEFRNHVHFTGWQKDVEAVVNTFDVGVLSTYTEGISNSILEYMALGKPVVATDGGGTNEIVLDGVTGYLVAPKNVEQTVSRIMNLLDNPAEARAKGIRGHNRVSEIFNIEGMGRRYFDLYHALINKSFPPRGSGSTSFFQ